MQDIYEYLTDKSTVFEKKFSNTITRVRLGSEDKKILEIGGDTSLPYFAAPHKKPQTALCILDSINDYPKPFIDEFGETALTPVAWASTCLDTCKPDALSLRFTVRNNHVWLKEAHNIVRNISGSCDLPLMLDVDGEPSLAASALQSLSEDVSPRTLLAAASLDGRYKILVKAATQGDHVLVAETDCDPTTQRTLNTKLLDEGLPNDRIVMDPTTAALGLGLEYSISIIEQLRSEALKGDTVTQFPIVAARAAPNSWRAREAWFEDPKTAPPQIRGPIWEAHTALALFLAGADLIAILHPTVDDMIKKIFGGKRRE